MKSVMVAFMVSILLAGAAVSVTGRAAHHESASQVLINCCLRGRCFPAEQGQCIRAGGYVVRSCAECR